MEPFSAQCATPELVTNGWNLKPSFPARTPYKCASLQTSVQVQSDHTELHTKMCFNVPRRLSYVHVNRKEIPISLYSVLNGSIYTSLKNKTGRARGRRLTTSNHVPPRTNKAICSWFHDPARSAVVLVHTLAPCNPEHTSCTSTFSLVLSTPDVHEFFEITNLDSSGDQSQK